MAAGVNYIAAEAEVLPHEGGIGSCDACGNPACQEGSFSAAQPHLGNSQIGPMLSALAGVRLYIMSVLCEAALNTAFQKHHKLIFVSHVRLAWQ